MILFLLASELIARYYIYIYIFITNFDLLMSIDLLFHSIADIKLVRLKLDNIDVQI